MIYLKKVFASFLGTIILILFLPLIIGSILLLFLIHFCLLPFRYARYKKSPFYRDFGLKYKSDYYCSAWYEVYNAIRANNLPIRCVPRYDEKGKLYWMNFSFGTKLLSFSLPDCTYDHEQNAFIITDVTEDERGICVPLEQYREELLTEWNAEHTEEERCDEIIFFITEKGYFESEEDIHQAKELPAFVFYNSKKLADALESFISCH